MESLSKSKITNKWKKLQLNIFFNMKKKNKWKKNLYNYIEGTTAIHTVFTHLIKCLKNHFYCIENHHCSLYINILNCNSSWQKKKKIIVTHVTTYHTYIFVNIYHENSSKKIFFLLNIIFSYIFKKIWNKVCLFKASILLTIYLTNENIFLTCRIRSYKCGSIHL